MADVERESEGMTVKCEIIMDDFNIDSNKHRLHCTGGTILSLYDEHTCVELRLTDKKLIELRDHLNWIIKFDKLEERNDQEKRIPHDLTPYYSPKLQNLQEYLILEDIYDGIGLNKG